MVDLLDQGMAWLKAKREAHMASPAEYRRGAAVTSVQVSIGKTVFRLLDDTGASIVVVTRDFLIGSDELPNAPSVGDQIEHSGQAYEVISPGGEPCWRWSDPYCRTRRIHTQHIGAA